MPNPGVLDNEPYLANDIGLVGALRDLKETMADKQTYSVVGYQCIVRGLLATSGLDEGDEYYLSAASAGAITKTPPTTASQYLTRIGEAAGSTELIIKLEPPILLS